MGLGGSRPHGEDGAGGGGEASEVRTSGGFLSTVKAGYEELVCAIIRPPRAEYEIHHLGPPEFDFCGKRFVRRDFEVTNERGQRLCCSQWEPAEYPPDGRLPVVIYMHGNSSARVEALPQLSLCLSLGITLLALDFAGSGMSQGDFVSLGWYERDDLKAVIEHLRRSERVSFIALWGRSMGAATALMHGERDPSIAAMVLDSPFADLEQLADEMVEKGREHGLNVPKFLTKIAIRMIRSSVQTRAGFNIQMLSPVSYAPRCFSPSLFVAGESDDFISPSHSRQIYDVYGGDRNIIIVPGDHNSLRPRFLFDSVAIFFQNTLSLREDQMLEGGDRYIGLPPWLSSEDGRFVYGMEEYWAFQDEEEEDMVVGSTGRLQREAAGLQVSSEVEDGGSSPSAAAANGHEPGSSSRRQMRQMDLGMTQARQREVQQALYSMLGAAPSPRGAGQHAPSSVQQYEAVGGSGEEWQCSLCTLVNHHQARACDACGAPAPPRESSATDYRGSNEEDESLRAAAARPPGC